ncbi:MAG: hypothetical protein ACR2NN_09665 [Bryobacteraceae bacterium]
MRNFGGIVTGTVIDNTTALLRRAGRWYLHSGIQQPNGGVARYYRSDLHKSALVSTEITGYAASFLFYLYDQTGAAEYLDGGLRAAHFLTRTAWDGTLELFPFEHSANNSDSDGLAYFFDSGIIVRSLLSAWRSTRQVEFLDKALTAGKGMLVHFNGPQAIHPILNLPSRQPRKYEPRWSSSPGCYQLKSAMAWFDLFEATGDQEMLAAYDAALEQALVSADGFLDCQTDRSKIMDRLHAYLYFLEGILPRAQETACAGALEKGIVRVAGYLREIAPLFARSDVYAQLLRIRLFADELGATRVDEAAAAQEAEAASSFQLHSPDPGVDGGFGFGTKFGELMPFVNPVSTAFCVQALTMWEQYQNGQLKAGYRALV